MDLIHIHDLRLWAHVGVLDHERRDGQWFQLDITLGLDLSESATSDDLSATADYSLAVLALQTLVSELSCLTIERFSEEVFEVVVAQNLLEVEHVDATELFLGTPHLFLAVV